MTKHYQLRFTDEAEAFSTISQVLTDLGIEAPETLQPKDSHVFSYTESIDGQEVSKKLVIDWHPSSPKELDENGEPVVLSTDEDGVPTYSYYSGYHIELWSNQMLDFPATFIVTPQIKQYKAV